MRVCRCDLLNIMWMRLLGIVIGVCVLWEGGRFGYDAWWRTPQAGGSVTVTVAPGNKAGVVAETLVASGLVDHAWRYRVFSWMSSSARHPRAGTYLIRPHTSWSELAKTIALGVPRNEVEVKIIEGKTVGDITEQLTGDFGVSIDEVKRAIGAQADAAAFDGAWRDEFTFLRALPRGRSLEGYLFPDTYRVWKDQLPEGLVRKQLQEFEAKFGTSKPTQKSAPLRTLDEVIILASVVEKEVRAPEDRRRVAGIFLERLRIGMALQSDATLTYITGSNRNRLTPEERAHRSAYNSYEHPGLPPSPISNPSASSIEAVLDSVRSGDLYFLTDRAGKVFYAKTYEQHLMNKQKAGY